MTWFGPQGGAVTSILSNMVLGGTSKLINNKAKSGGAILAFESTISISGRTTIAQNQAVDDGGSIYIHYSNLVIVGLRLYCFISNSSATRGGAIHGIGESTKLPP